MNISADSHLFGSRKGYECLAKSAGVTSSEDRQLSEFGFGQSTDEHFLHGLATQPTAFGRPLSSGRVAITRVMVGPLDDGGRPTLERRTMIVSAADYLAIRHDLKALIKDNVWGSSAFAGGLPIQVPSAGTSRRGAADALAWRIFDAWVIGIESRPPRGVVIAPAAAGGDQARAADAVLALASQLADEDAVKFKWGIRLLSPIEWSDVLTLSSTGVMDGRRPVHGIGAACIKPEVQRAQAASPGMLPTVTSLQRAAIKEDLEFVDDGMWDGVGGGGIIPPQGLSVKRKQPKRALIIAAIVLPIIGLTALGTVIWWIRSRPAPISIPAPTPTTKPAPAPAPASAAAPAPARTPDPTADPKPDPKPDPTADPKPDPTADPKPDPTADPKPEPTKPANSNKIDLDDKSEKSFGDLIDPIRIPDVLQFPEYVACKEEVVALKSLVGLLEVAKDGKLKFVFDLSNLAINAKRELDTRQKFKDGAMRFTPRPPENDFKEKMGALANWKHTQLSQAQDRVEKFKKLPDCTYPVLPRPFAQTQMLDMESLSKSIQDSLKKRPDLMTSQERIDAMLTIMHFCLRLSVSQRFDFQETKALEAQLNDLNAIKRILSAVVESGPSEDFGPAQNVLIVIQPWLQNEGLIGRGTYWIKNHMDQPTTKKFLFGKYWSTLKLKNTITCDVLFEALIGAVCPPDYRGNHVEDRLVDFRRAMRYPESPKAN